MITLTKNQKAALARDKNLAVTAGAGTGKTLILVERYLDILLNEEIDIKQLLAITFTNKAAAEMIDRVAKRIEVQLSETIDTKKRQQLLTIRNHLSSAYISTIHSFCSRLLREYPLEAGGLDPGFKQLNEVQTDFLIDESIEAEVSSLDSTENRWLHLFRMFGADRLKSMLRASLSHRFEIIRVQKMFADLEVEDIFKRLIESFIRISTDHLGTGYLNDLRSRFENFIVIAKDRGDVSEIRGRILAEINRLVDAGDASDLPFWQALYSLGQSLTKNDGFAYKDVSRLGGKKSWSVEEANHLVRLSEALVSLAQWQKENISIYPDEFEQTVLKNLKNFYDLYQHIENRFTEAKRNIGAVDYEDLQLFVWQMLRDNEDIRNQVAARFSYIMVDEFQDTNQLQWEILSLLSKEQANKLFIVGDPKQSIYGFRDADVRVFNQVKKEFEQQYINSNHLLFESYRFKETVSQFVNHTFSTIMHTVTDNPWEVAYDHVETEREDRSGGRIDFALLNKSDEDDVQADFIANHLIDLLATKAYKPGEIAIILRNRNHLTEIEKKLRDHDLPFQTIGGIGFYQGQEIYDTFHLLKFLINPADNLALVGLLRSPFANISDEGLFFLAQFEPDLNYWEKISRLKEIDNLPESDRSKLKIFFNHARRWITRRDRVGYFELLSEIFNDSLYRAVAAADLRGEQIIANIDKILNITLEYEKGRFSSIVDFADTLNHLINTYIKEGEAALEFESENSVKILTIHQSKGLEFPVVYLPYLEQRVMATQRKPVYFDEEFGVGASIQNAKFRLKERLSDSYYLLDRLKMIYRNKEIAELKRLLYVGCTRARDQVVLVGELPDNTLIPDTALTWLMQSLDQTPDHLKNGPFRTESGTIINIYRDYNQHISTEEKKRQKTLRSLQTLKKLKIEQSDDKNRPYFLKAITDQPRGEIFSATQLMTFKYDRAEYQKRYHLGFFEDDYEELGLGVIKESDALLKGTLLHRLMEDYPDYDIDLLIQEMDIVDEFIVNDLRREVLNLAKQIEKSEIIKSVLGSKNYKTEVNIIGRLGNDFLTGTLDRIYQNESGRYCVIDYKTNRIDKTDVEQTVNKYRVQMDIYALLMAGAFPDQGEYDIGLYFIYPDNLYHQKYSSSRLKQKEQEYVQLIDEIKKYYPYTDIQL